MIKLISDKDITLVEDQSILAKFIRSVSKQTAIELATLTGQLKPYVSKAEAYKIAGSRRVVDKWIEEGELIDHSNSGGSFRISRADLDSLMGASDLIKYQIEKENERIRENRITKAGKRSA
ncbi:hypothetical protein [Sphingobacterium kyonggiense]